MTNAQLIQTIRAEIERLRKNNDISDDECAQYEYDVACGYDMACDNILSFLSTLESEKPMDQDGLEEEIESFWKENGPMSHAQYDRLAKCARHFAKWQKEQMLKEAVEGKIAERVQGKLYVRCQVPKTMGVEFGDKVRIIVIPKED